MIRPRWLRPRPRSSAPLLLAWDRFVALWGALNLLFVAFDITYVPLRTFWLQRNLYPIPSVPLAVPLTFIPDIAPLVDPIKGIEPHRETEGFLRQFSELEKAMDTPGTDPSLPNSTPSFNHRRSSL